MRRMRKTAAITCFFIINAILTVTFSPAQNSRGSDRDTLKITERIKNLTAYRSPNGKIKIDGILDEEIWNFAQQGESFIQNEPEEGKPATEKTTVQIAYDDHAIYAGMVTHEKNFSDIHLPRI